MKNRIIQTPNAPAPIGPYNQAILNGDSLFISGQIALDPISGNLALDSISKETALVLSNLKAILDAADFEKEHIVKCTIFLSSMAHFEAMNQEYASFFGAYAPARECVAVKALPKNVNVEISAIAMR